MTYFFTICSRKGTNFLPVFDTSSMIPGLLTAEPKACPLGKVIVGKTVPLCSVRCFGPCQHSDHHGMCYKRCPLRGWMTKCDFSSGLAQDLGRGVVAGFQPLSTPQLGPFVRRRHSVIIHGGPGKFFICSTVGVAPFTNEEAKSWKTKTSHIRLQHKE